MTERLSIEEGKITDSRLAIKCQVFYLATKYHYTAISIIPSYHCSHIHTPKLLKIIHIVTGEMICRDPKEKQSLCKPSCHSYLFSMEARVSQEFILLLRGEIQYCKTAWQDLPFQQFQWISQQQKQQEVQYYLHWLCIKLLQQR